MKTISARVAKILEREFIEGTIYRVDLDRVDVAPVGSAGVLRALPLAGDRDKVRPGDRVRVITVAGERVALAGDVALQEGGGETAQDASAIALEEILLKYRLSAGESISSEVSNTGNPGWVYLQAPLYNPALENAVYSTTARTAVNASNGWGVPEGAKAVLVRVAARDTASATAPNAGVFLWPTGTVLHTPLACRPGGKANGVYDDVLGVVPLDDGNLWWSCTSSGTNTLTVFVQVWGYLLGEDSLASGWVFFQNNATSPNWTAKTLSTTTTKTKIDLSAEYSLPDGIAAVVLRGAVKDTGSAAGDASINLSASSAAYSTNGSFDCSGQANNTWSRASIVCPCDANGDVWYHCNTTGPNSMTINLDVAGYLLPVAAVKADASTLQGYAPGTSGADAHVVVTDYSGNILSGAGDWLYLAASYRSPASVDTPGNQASRFPKGTKVRLYQSGYKYFYVLSTVYDGVSVTTISLTGGSDYSVANAPITEFAYSHVQIPEGFPEWFNYVPTWYSTGAYPNIGNGILRGQFKLDGSLLTMALYQDCSSATTYGSGTYRWSLPVPVCGGTDWVWFGGGHMRDSSTSARYIFTLQVNSGDSFASYCMLMGSPSPNASFFTPASPVTWASSDEFYFSISYPI